MTGYFLEVARLGKGLAEQYAAATTQVSARAKLPRHDQSISLPSTPNRSLGSGRRHAATGTRRPPDVVTLPRPTEYPYVGSLRPWQVRIPPRVAHEYKVLGSRPLLVYMTDRFYDPADEGRLAFDDPKINYDWETQHK